MKRQASNGLGMIFFLFLNEPCTCFQTTQLFETCQIMYCLYISCKPTGHFIRYTCSVSWVNIQVPAEPENILLMSEIGEEKGSLRFWQWQLKKRNAGNQIQTTTGVSSTSNRQETSHYY